jgi:hypothetical protein
VTVKVICVVVREVIAIEVPLATPLMFLVSRQCPQTIYSHSGAVPPISKMNPLGAFRMIVSIPTSLVAVS